MLHLENRTQRNGSNFRTPPLEKSDLLLCVTFDEVGRIFFIPETRVLPSSVTSLKIAAGLEETGMSYFDSLISAIVMEKDAVVLTSDEAISKIKW